MVNLLVESLKGLEKPNVIFFCKGMRYEGIVLAIDEKYIQFHDPQRYYTKFLKIDDINELEIKD